MSNLFSFNGRISRREWWLVTSIPAVVLAGFFLVGYYLLFVEKGVHITFQLIIIGIILLILSLGVFFIMTAAAAVKRYHDLGMSGVWYFIVFIPFGWIIQFVQLGFLPGNPGDNMYGPNPENIEQVSSPENQAGPKEKTVGDLYQQ